MAGDDTNLNFFRILSWTTTLLDRALPFLCLYHRVVLYFYWEVVIRANPLSRFSLGTLAASRKYSDEDVSYRRLVGLMTDVGSHVLHPSHRAYGKLYIRGFDSEVAEISVTVSGYYDRK